MLTVQRWFSRFPRLWGWWVVAAALIGVVVYVSPHQFPVVVYKLSMVTVSAVIAYWIDRSLFKLSAQPRIDLSMQRDQYSAMRLIARALIYLGTVLGITLGL